MTRKRSVLPGHRSQPLSIQVETGLLMFFLVMAGLLVLFMLLNVMITNASATRGYELRLLLNQREQLLKSQEVLSMRISDLQSLETLRTTGTQLGLVNAPDPERITVRSDQIEAFLFERQQEQAALAAQSLELVEESPAPENAESEQQTDPAPE